MRKVFKWVAIVIGAVIGLIVLAVAGIAINTNARMNRTYDRQPEAVTIPTDATSVEHGRKWAAVYCTGCHGEDLAGTVMFEDPSLGRIEASNLTAGLGGVARVYSDADWVQAIRHGVASDGKPLLVMPAGDYYYLSDADLGAIIAYVKSLPPVDKEVGGYELSLMARILEAMGAFGETLPAENIDHTGPRPAAPDPGVSMAYGEYLVATFGCRTCHGGELAGGKDPNPEAPPGPNLTPGGALRGWSEEDFVTAARTRVSRWMPWKGLSHMADDELEAIWLYLQLLPPRESAQQ